MTFIHQIASDFSIYIILFLVTGIVVSIFADWLSPSQAFISATIILILTGIIQVNDFLISFSNQQIITIFILIFITVAIRRHIDVNLLFEKVFPQKLSNRGFVFKMSVVVAFFSSFLNNTPIVSMLTSNVQYWARKKDVSPSKFLIPLSYAAMLGGMITIIGTSTNLVLMGLIDSNGDDSLHLIDFFVVGIVVTIIGILYISFMALPLLPDRKIAIKQFAENKGEYIHEVELENENDLIGKSVIDAGFKNLQGIYLVEILRDGKFITPVGPEENIQEEDHFYFAGDTERVVNFVRGKEGLMLSSEEKLVKEGSGNIVEVLVAANSNLSGVLVKDSNFREKYNASIIGIHRNGEKISGKIGHLRLRSGDLLLLLTGNDFENRISVDKNLYLLSRIAQTFLKNTVKHKQLYWLLQIVLAIFVFTDQITFFIGLLVSLFLLVFFKYLNIDSIKRNFNFDLLIVLACSLTIGKAFIDTGAAEFISNEFLTVMHTSNIHVVLSALFILTAILTSLITNVAAVSIAFPIAFALSHHMQVDSAPFYLVIAFAASAAFITPMAYQTNMMVYGPGGYKSIDFLKVGFPLLLIYMISSLLMIFWWFEL